MQSQKQKRYVAYLLLVASFALSAASASSQERRPGPASEIPIIKVACPRPIALTLAASTPNVVNSAFSAVQLAAPRAWLNDAAANKAFVYSFRLPKQEGCCEVTQAILTVKMTANQSGASKTSSDAGNDGIALMHLGSVVPGYSQPVYSSWPFPAGQTVTKTWNLTGVALNNINSTGTVNIWVQDDTRVNSATLQFSGCCLSLQRRDVTEGSSTATNQN